MPGKLECPANIRAPSSCPPTAPVRENDICVVAGTYQSSLPLAWILAYTCCRQPVGLMHPEPTAALLAVGRRVYGSRRARMRDQHLLLLFYRN
jgi:hypothetical protein